MSARPGRRGALLLIAALLAARVQAANKGWVLDRTATDTLPTSPAAQAAIDRFAAAYARAGRPRIALFWNRDLTDRIEADSRDVLRVNTQRSRDGNDQALTATRGREITAEPVRSTSLSERDLWLVETEFAQRLLDAGAVLIDRATIVRLTAGSASAPGSMPSVEMAALSGKADLLLEVLLTRDEAAPLGWGFRSNCKDVRSGRLLGTQYLSAMPELPPLAEPVFRAGPKGYEKVEAPPARVTIRSIGEALSVQAMTELSRRLVPR